MAQPPGEQSIPKGLVLQVPAVGSEAILDLMPEQTIFSEDFADGGARWIQSGSWVIGTAAHRTNSHLTTMELAATSPSGQYPNDADAWLISPEINLSPVKLGLRLTLIFSETFELESGYDYGYVKISVDNGHTWIPLSARDGGSDWRPTRLDLTPYAGRQIKLAFHLHADASFAFRGWSIDNVRIIRETMAPITATLTSLNSQNFPFIYMNVDVTSLGSPLPGLNQSNFQVQENGVTQSDFFTVIPPGTGGGSRLADIIFLIDDTGSMSNEIAAVRTNVNAFVTALASSGIDYALGLVTFKDNVTPFNNGILTRSSSQFQTWVNGLTATGGGDTPENSFGALQVALSTFSFRPGSQRIFIVITDAQSHVPPAPSYVIPSPPSQSQIISSLRNATVTCYAVAIVNTQYSGTGSISEATGGKFFNVTSPFLTILNDITTVVGRTYVVSYRSSDPVLNGIKRNVVITVTQAADSDTATGSYIPGAAPSIRRTPATINLSNSAQIAGSALTIAAEVTDAISPFVQSVTLYYRPTGTINYVTLNMPPIGSNIYQAIIPGGAVVAPGIDYYIQATDGQASSSDPSVEAADVPYQIAVLPNQPPLITHTPVTSANRGNAVTITATVVDNTNFLSRTELHYRQFGTLLFNVVTMSGSGGNQYNAAIPGSSVNAGVEYFIRAVDNFGVASIHGVHFIRVDIIIDPPPEPCTATFSDNFEGGTDNWLALTPTSWGINLIGSDQAFCLSVPNPVRDEYAVLRDALWLDFDLTLEAKSDATSNKNFFVMFGTTDFPNAPSNGYYLQFALGGVKLYRSTGGGSGVEIASAARDYVSDNLFHRIRVERKRPNIQVTVDGTVVINVNDGAFAIGSIGFGSFNSQACFDDVNIFGARAEPSFYIDAFDDGDAAGWSPLTPSRWQVSNESGSLRYLINTTNYEPPNSTRLGELSVLTGKSWGDFVFECHAKSADAATANENADLCLVFGYQDFDSYYYVNFNTAPGLTQLFRTHNGVNTVLATYAQSTFLAGDAAYHALRVERSGSEIRAYFDGREVLASNDSFFGAGLVGLGSYNDAGYFDNIAVTKKCEELPPTPAELVADKIFLRTGQNSGPEVTDPVAGQSYYLHFNWRNAGGVASSFRLQLKLNSAVICEYNSGTIAAGSSQNSWCTTPIVWPLSNAEIVIEGVLDPNNVINEPNESNNIVGQTFPPNAQTNLTATTLVFSPAAVTRGSSINLSGAVTNNGAVPTGSGFKVSFYLSTNSGAPDFSLLLGSVTMTALNAGQSNSFSLSGTVPATTPAPAQYFVWMSVDADNAIPESNESDNLLRATSQLSVTILPAAGIRPVTAFPQYAIGAEFVVDITVNDATNLFGLSFELNYTNTAFIDVVTPTNSNVLPGPFLGNDVVFVHNVDEPAGKVGIGISRKSGQGGVSGNGVVASVRFKSLTSTPPNTPILLTLISVSASDPNGAALPLAASSHTVNIVGLVVWPGDTNNDRIVNQADVLPLGLYWNRTGPPRARITCEWAPQPATPWSPEAATYADANGDGVVNQADVLCIGLNWGRTHTTLLAKPEEGRMIDAAPIRMSTTVIGSVNPGEDFEIAVAAEQTENLFGAAFELLYAPASLLDPQSITAGNLLGDDVVFFPNVDHNAGKISVGLSRKAGQDGVAGKGVVAKIKMRLASQTLHGQAITLTLQEMTINNPAGQLLPVQSAVGSSIIVGVGSRRSGALPTAFKLQQNSPNPFNPATEIFYDLPEPSDVHLEIFDMLGKHVRTLVQERQNAGSYSAIWDSRDANGQMVASGVYLYQLRAGTFSQTRRMSLLR